MYTRTFMEGTNTWSSWYSFVRQAGGDYMTLSYEHYENTNVDAYTFVDFEVMCLLLQQSSTRWVKIGFITSSSDGSCWANYVGTKKLIMKKVIGDYDTGWISLN